MYIHLESDLLYVSGGSLAWHTYPLEQAIYVTGASGCALGRPRRSRYGGLVDRDARGSEAPVEQDLRQHASE